MNKYGKKTSEAIIRDYSEYMVVKENGVWPSKDCLRSDPSQYAGFA